MKEIGLVLIYLVAVVYSLFCFFPLVNRIPIPPPTPISMISLIIIHCGPFTQLPIHAGCIFFPALAFLLHPHVWKNVLACRGWSKNAESTSDTKYSVPPEGDDIHEGYTIRPSDGGGYGSTTTSLLFAKAIGQ